MSNLIYKEPCLECGNVKYGDPIFIEGEGPFCSRNCRISYFVKQGFNVSSLIEGNIPEGFIIETGKDARLKIKTINNGNDLVTRLLHDASKPTSF
jgi:hypothetical protein